MPEYDLRDLNALIPPDPGRAYSDGYLDGLLAAEEEFAAKEAARHLARAMAREARQTAAMRWLGWACFAAAVVLTWREFLR